jgi:hypothetical protein
VFTNTVTCNDSNACTTDVCDPATGQCVFTNTVTCNDTNACTSDVCDPATGQCVFTNTVTCDDNNACTDDVCDPATGQCVFTPNDNPLCAPVGCRITAGGIGPNNLVNPDKPAGTIKDTFGGQVGAPCGCIGQFALGDEAIQGNWTNMRKPAGSGSFHATDFNSLVCGCDGVLDGQLCNDRDRGPGPFPPPAPANLICFSGTGLYNETSGQRTIEVAFRVDAEDRSQPGGGTKNNPPSVYRIRIWIPTGTETAESLADQVACTNTVNPDLDLCDPTVRAPDIDDGGDLINGAIQIHPQIDPHVGICPVPDEACPAPACQ